MKYEGSLYFDHELTAGEILRIQQVLTTAPDASKPNNGIFPFNLVDFERLEWDESEAYEMSTLIKLVIERLSPLKLSGTMKCFDDEFPENSHKLYIKNNKISVYKIDDTIIDTKLLRCPHCQKIFSSDAFKEVTESEFVKDI